MSTFRDDDQKLKFLLNQHEELSRELKKQKDQVKITQKKLDAIKETLAHRKQLRFVN